MSKGSSHKQFQTAFVSNKGSPHFFIIGGFVQSSLGERWAILKRCTVIYPPVIEQLPDISQHTYMEISTPNFFQPDTHSSVCYLDLDSNIKKSRRATQLRETR